MKKLILILLISIVGVSCKKDKVDNVVHIEVDGFIDSEYDLTISSKSKGLLIAKNNDIEAIKDHYALPAGDAISGSLTIRRHGIRGVGWLIVKHRDKVIFQSKGAGTVLIGPLTIE